MDRLLRHQQDLHENLLGQLSRLSEIQEFVATCAAELVGVPHTPTLTLQRSLEAASRLGPGFLLSSGSETWTACELLALFQQMQPQSLQMATSLFTPGVTSAGAIYEVGEQGKVITDAPLFHIERPRPGQQEAQHGA
ncbi:MAG TPA: hypothetical protein VKT82_13695 [Ktedonobacterales bacterium]|nr:hypothetical protein [Ktedonobacterales bacterium]